MVSDTDLARLAAHLADWILAEVSAGEGLGVVFGLSGGLDSAVVAGLAKRAFPRHALGVIMPCHSDPQDQADAQLVAHHFELATATVDLSSTYDTLLAELTKMSAELPDNRLACANVKPRLRMTVLYSFANHLGYRVLGTGNRSEITVGYCTKYGDAGVDYLPLGNLTKTEVRALAEHLGVPHTIVAKPPSAGLWAGQTDEGEMGFTYEELDRCLQGASGELCERVERIAAACSHKRELPKMAPLPTPWPAGDPGGEGAGPRADA